MSHACRSTPRGQHGRTLVELLISITIGLVILLALATVYQGTTRTGRQTSAISRMSEDAAITFGLLGGNLRMAGYSTPRALTLPGGAIYGGIRATAPDRDFTGAGIRGCDHGFMDEKQPFDALACQTADTSLPAAFAIRFDGDASNTVPIGADNDPSDCLQSAVTTGTPSAIDPSRNYRLIESRFTAKVGGSGTPELFCSGNGNSFTPQPLIQWVEDVQLRYGVALDSTTREVTHYATAAQVDALAGSVDERWSRVVNVRLCTVMLSQGKDQAGAGNYIDCDGNSVASANGFARRAFTSFYALRNRSGFLTPPVPTPPAP